MIQLLREVETLIKMTAQVKRTKLQLVKAWESKMHQSSNGGPADKIESISKENMVTVTVPGNYSSLVILSSVGQFQK